MNRVTIDISLLEKYISRTDVDKYIEENREKIQKVISAVTDDKVLGWIDPETPGGSVVAGKARQELPARVLVDEQPVVAPVD